MEVLLPALLENSDSPTNQPTSWRTARVALASIAHMTLEGFLLDILEK